MKKRRYVKIQGQVLKLTNLDKVFFPSSGMTKLDMIRYYRRIADTVLPHLRDRPFTFKRYPQGTGDPGRFYQKECPTDRPYCVDVVAMGGKRYCVINNIASLIWAANLATIELHTTLARRPRLDSPTTIAFDLDPGEGAELRDCLEVAFLVQELLARQGLQGFLKTSGKKGIHLYLPLNTPASYEMTKAFARSVAEILARKHADRVVSKMNKELRRGKVFIDWSQNADFKTTVTVYSLRAEDFASVSTPITWIEAKAALKRGSLTKKLLTFEPHHVLERVEKRGDLFAGVLTTRQKLTFFEAGGSAFHRG